MIFLIFDCELIFLFSEEVSSSAEHNAREIIIIKSKICDVTKLEPREPRSYKDFESSPKDEEFAQLTESEREAEFRRKRQEYINEKINRKKEILKQKRRDFGDSSSEESEDEGLGSRSSKSSAEKTDVIENQNTKVEPDVVEEKKAPEPKVEVQSPQKKYSESLEKYNVNVAGKKSGEWSKDILVIGDKNIIIQNLTEEFRSFTKVKIFCEVPSPKIKISIENKEILFTTSGNEEKMGLPLNYYIFAKLIQEKLISTGIKLKPSEKPSGISEVLTSGSIFYGRISKKSQILKNWEERIVVVNNTGIFSYKKENQRHSMLIPKACINELWTRFEFHENLLVIKIWHSGRKTEFGFPLTDNLTTNCWLYAFYTMMGKTK